MRFGSRRWMLDRASSEETRDEEPAATPRAPTPLCVPPITDSARHDAPLPDLLNPERAVTVDAPLLMRVLAFAFVSGDDGGVLANALERAPLARSSFDPSCFFHELYVEDFVRTCMRVHVGGKSVRLDERFLHRLLSQPPLAEEPVAQRREIFRELAEGPTKRSAVEALYAHLRELRRLFEGEDRLGIHGEQARRRIDMLRALRESFVLMRAPALRGATSALARLGEFAEHVQATQAYERLDELLRYENERAYADLTLQLAADGSIRGLSLVRVREDRANRYHVSLLRRIVSRLSLLLRGYRVSDAEIVDRWLDHVFEGMNRFIPALLQLIGDLEFYLAGIALRDLCRARDLPVCFAEWCAAGVPSAVEGLYNPLLFAQSVQPVACSLTLGEAGVTTLITGPNSGGKTRLLQAVGLLHLCARNGMFVPAARATVARVPGIFASLSQPSGADQPEGRLGTELLRIRMLFERAEPEFLVLVDELCSGTSPSEGEELFRLVLGLLRELSPISLVSTHFLKLAATLQRESELPLHFLQIELDNDQRPTYRFIAGVAETSLAKQTAARLGVTREELLALLATKRRHP